VLGQKERLCFQRLGGNGGVHAILLTKLQRPGRMGGGRPS
jgi:hypothetical protein